ncbi:MAG: tetratricopeptide repeat protein [Prevotella sp.]|jgi:tetratricopeptide (TPR) repeat protein|nr:tetratricopeptide repeat protein [Prevotella sp.]
MKRIIIITLLAFVTVGLSAQKAVRKAIRSGNKAYNEQLYGTAQGEYEKAIAENASSKEASYNLANSFYKQQKWDEALKEYQHYLTLENEDKSKMSAAWSNMGNTFLKKKANEKAQNPGPMAAAQMQAQGQQVPQQQQQGGGQQADNLKMSMEAYKNALRLNPADDDTRYNLAVVQKILKDKEDQDQNQDNKQDQKQDQNKDQKEDPKQDPKQDPNKDPKKDKQDQQPQENQMSQDNIQQILQAIEQDEKETQERVKQAKAEERKKQQDRNKKQNKDW